jgi:hypothetical protein
VDAIEGIEVVVENDDFTTGIVSTNDLGGLIGGKYHDRCKCTNIESDRPQWGLPIHFNQFRGKYALGLKPLEYI